MPTRPITTKEITVPNSLMPPAIPGHGVDKNLAERVLVHEHLQGAGIAGGIEEFGTVISFVVMGLVGIQGGPQVAEILLQLHFFSALDSDARQWKGDGGQ